MLQLSKLPLAGPLGLVMAMAALSGCMSSYPGETDHYSAPVGGSPVFASETPYSDALRCMVGNSARHPIRVAVGQIDDYTGQTDRGSATVTEGAALMAMSALAKAGVPLVERFDPSVAGNGRATTSLPRPDYVLAGGITELNGAAGGSADTTRGVVTVGLDLRLIDSRTLEVVDVISYRKQLTGGAGNGMSVDFAVRWTIERAVLEMMSRLYHNGGDSCAVAATGAPERSTATDTMPSDDVSVPAAINNLPSVHEKVARFYPAQAQSTEPELRRRFDR